MLWNLIMFQNVVQRKQQYLPCVEVAQLTHHHYRLSWQNVTLYVQTVTRLGRIKESQQRNEARCNFGHAHQAQTTHHP